MNRFRDPSWSLIILFVGLIAIVPLVQIFKGYLQGDEGTPGSFHMFDGLPTAESLRAFEEKLEANSWAAKASTPLIQFSQFKWLKDGGEKVVVGSSGWYFYKPGVTYMLARPQIVEAAKKTNDPVGAIVHFRDQLAARGVRLLVMPVPNKESVYPDRLTGRAANARGVMAPRTREILEQLRARDIEVVDLFKEFAAARQGTEREIPLYLAQDTHWSPHGVQLAAKAAARRLGELGWISPGKVEYQQKPAAVKRVGDLVRMLQSAMIEKTIEPETVPAVQIVQAGDGQLYKDEPMSEVLVLGDSFTRIYQQDTPTSAGFVSYLAKELKQPVMSLVNDGGGATLVREELNARPVFLLNKKVVIWEFVERDFGLAVKGWQRINIPEPVRQKEGAPVGQPDE